jgi:2-oxoglutarate ferredoxin oxidoreductase subunit beta
VFNGLHGRSLPVATGAKLANGELTVIAESGDGCNYGEGGNHFLAAVRRNVNMTLLAHNNLIYGLTKGQASPTTPEEFVTKAQPDGVFSAPFNPIAVAISLGAGFVARGFAGMGDHLAGLIEEAIAHPGFSLVDILQPCVSFNKVHTFGWFKERCYTLPDHHDPHDRKSALERAFEWGDTIPLGIIYKNDRNPLDERIGALKKGSLKDMSTDLGKLGGIMDKVFS